MRFAVCLLCDLCSVVYSELTAVIDHQWDKWNFLVFGDTRQHLIVCVASFAVLPLLQPVKVTGADQRVVPQHPEGEKKQHKLQLWSNFPWTTHVQQFDTQWFPGCIFFFLCTVFSWRCFWTYKIKIFSYVGSLFPRMKKSNISKHCVLIRQNILTNWAVEENETPSRRCAPERWKPGSYKTKDKHKLTSNNVYKLGPSLDYGIK